MANTKPQHPLYGSIKLGDELSNRMNVAGSDGGAFKFGRVGSPNLLNLLKSEHRPHRLHTFRPPVKGERWTVFAGVVSPLLR